MRSQRPIAIPLSLIVTFCVWFAFLWTMQHTPGRRPLASAEGGTARSSGGLANQFASAVVNFFDQQDPREIPESAPLPEAAFEGEIIEFLPLPPANRSEIRPQLREIYENPALTTKDLFRSDVDLDGDRDLDLALLARLGPTEALGAVLEYVGDDHFRFAGKFPCAIETAAGLARCFQVMRTASGAMHIVRWEPESGFTVFRLEEGELREKFAWKDECPVPEPQPPQATPQPSPAPARARLRPIGRIAEDLFRLETDCAEPCRILRYRPQSGDYTWESAKPEWCEDQPLEDAESQ